MARFRDGARSFAIDRFPEMEAGAVEAFHDASVERRRAARARALADLELDYCDGPGDDCGAETEASYLERTSAELLDELKDAARRPDRRSRAQDVLEKRAEEDRLRHLVDLHKRTTYELDAIARDEADLATRRAIAKQVLDERMGLAS
jgi:hypothetical protein